MSTPPPKVEDWLPHDPPPQPKPSTFKTLVTWVVLIGFFIAIFVLFSTDDPNAHQQTGYSGWWIAAGIVGTLVVVVMMLGWLFGSADKFNTAQTEALQLLVDRKYHEAATFFEQLAHRYRARPNCYAVARYNQGKALLHAGDSAAAAGILLAIDRIPKVGIGIRKLGALQLARCFAVAGDLEKATSWLDAARRRGTGLADPVHDRAFYEAVEGLVMCRAGKLAEAAAHYDQAWPRFTTYLPIEAMTEVWLLRAYAAAAGTTPRDAAAGETWLRMLRSCSPRSLDWLTTRWPELHTFVVTHELGAQAA